jgi:hypothetical protein
VAQFTPGPWEMPGLDGDEYVICTDKAKGKRRTVAHAYSDANARLIAAAPDMLSALEMIASLAGGQLPDYARSIHDIARAAIAKAEGR